MNFIPDIKGPVLTFPTDSTGATLIPPILKPKGIDRFLFSIQLIILFIIYYSYYFFVCQVVASFA